MTHSIWCTYRYKLDNEDISEYFELGEWLCNGLMTRRLFIHQCNQCAHLMFKLTSLFKQLRRVSDDQHYTVNLCTERTANATTQVSSKSIQWMAASYGISSMFQYGIKTANINVTKLLFYNNV